MRLRNNLDVDTQAYIRNIGKIQLTRFCFVSRMFQAAGYEISLAKSSLRYYYCLDLHQLKALPILGSEEYTLDARFLPVCFVPGSAAGSQSYPRYRENMRRLFPAEMDRIFWPPYVQVYSYKKYHPWAGPRLQDYGDPCD